MRPERPASAPFRPLALALLIGLAALPAAAQNLLPNGTFDHDIAGWSLFAESLSPSWSPLDADGSPSSGSLRVIDDFPANDGTYSSAAQCVPAVPGTSYRARGRFLYPEGQPNPGAAALGIYFSDGPNCSGSILLQVDEGADLPPGAWVSLDTGDAVAPPGTQWAYISFGFREVGVGGSAIFHLDDASFATSDPDPPAGDWLSVPDLPGFRFKVRITPAGGTPAPGTQVADCVPETVCVAGALPTRTEVFLRVIGPRPNGYLWPQIVRFTISQVEVWVEQLSSGQVNYYLLPALPPSTDELPGLSDRTGFLP